MQEHATERDRLLSDVRSLQQQVDEKHRAVEELSRQVQAKSEHADDLTRQLHEKSSAVSDFEAQLRQVHEALQGVEERMKSVEQERTALHQHAEDLQRELRDKSARVSALSEVEARQCDVIDELQQQLQELKREWEQRGEELVKLHKTVEALKHDKQLLQESINTLQLATHAVNARDTSNKVDKAPATNTRESVSTASHKSDTAKSDASTVRHKDKAASDEHAAPTKNEVSLASPKRASTRTEPPVSGPIVQFSGFKDSCKKYNEALKNSLTEFVVDVMKGQVHDSAEFSHQITHVVTPPHTRTLKTLSAVLTCKWLVTPDWLIDAQQAHAANPSAPLLSPDSYGIRLREAPLKDKTFAFHRSFSTGSQGAANLKNAEILFKVGKGKRVKESEASVVLVGDDLEGQKSNYYTWTQFMDMILEHVPPNLKDTKRKIDKVSSPEAPKHKRAKIVNK